MSLKHKIEFELEFYGPVNTIKVMSSWTQLFKANDIVS